MAAVGVCDGDAVSRRTTELALLAAGHRVVSAASGAVVLRLFGENGAVDALVLEALLPDSDGRDVCQVLRSRGVVTPVLFATAVVGVHARLRGFGAGADDYLEKPFDPRELVARVEALVLRARGPWDRTGVPTHSPRGSGAGGG